MTHVWAEQVSGVAVNLRSVSYKSGLWVSVGDTGTILTSVDAGVTWTPRTSGVTNSLRTVKHWQGNWYIVGRSLGGATAAVVLKSSDAITWSDISGSVTSVGDELVDMDLSDTALCFVGWNATAGILYTTTDGTTFSSPGTLGTADFCYGVTWNAVDSLWGVVGSVSGTAQWFGTSPDLVTWTKKTVTGAVGEIWTIIHDGTNWIVSENLVKIYTSPDSTTWTYRPEGNMGSDNPWRLTRNSLGTTLLSGGFNTGKIIESDDGGSTWELSYDAGSGTSLMSRTEFGGSTWVGVGWAGTIVTAEEVAALDVGSWYHAQGLLPSPNIIRKFIVGSQDYSDRVKKWPTIKTDHSRVRPGKVTISLSNTDQELNRFTADKTTLMETSVLQFGYEALGGFTEGRPVVNGESYAGNVVCISDDGQVMVVGDPLRVESLSPGTGAISVYARHSTRWRGQEHDVWELTQTIKSTFPGSGRLFGTAIDLDSTGKYLIAGNPYYVDSSAQTFGTVGMVHAYAADSAGVFQSTADMFFGANSFARTGASVSVSSGGHRIIVGRPGQADAGNAWTLEWTGSNYGLINVLAGFTGFGDSSGDLYGSSVKMSDDGSTVCAIAPYGNGESGVGFVYKYAAGSGFYDGGVSTCLSQNAASGDLLGYVSKTSANNSIAMTPDGSVIAIGAPLAVTSVTRGGAAYIYVESNNAKYGLWENSVVYPTEQQSYGYFGAAVDMSPDGAVLAIGAPVPTLPTVGGSVTVLRKSAVTSPNYDILQTIIPTNTGGVNPGYNDFGSGVALSKQPGATLMVAEAGIPADHAYLHTFFSNSNANVGANSYHSSVLVDLYKGTIDRAVYGGTSVTLSLQDRMRVLKERYMGSDDAPVVFSNNILPGDLFWTAVTCYGGLSAIANSSNPDIDFVAYQAWDNRTRDDSLFMGGYFKGVRIIEVLSKLARVTDSSITIEKNRIVTRRWSHAESISQDFNISNASMNVSVDVADMINDQLVSGDYSTESRSYRTEISVQDLPSVNSFGIREHSEKDSAIWFVSSNSCRNLGQRKVVFNKSPVENIIIDTYLPGLTRRIGDTITTTNSVHDHAGFISRVTGRSVNMDAGKIQITANPSILLAGFVLDVDSLDTTVKFLT